MTLEETYLSKIVVDVCSRSILLIDNEGTKKFVKCDTANEFLSALEFCRAAENFIDSISYAQVAVVN